MKAKRELPWSSVWGGFILAVGMMAVPPKVLANVYATNIRVNDGTNVVAAAGDSVTVTYLLNEPATLGATVQIRSGNTVVRSIEVPAGAQGTIRGVNTVTWDTTTTPVPSGTYSIAVVARSSGYTNWTQITSDTTDPNTYVFDGRGIAVDRNPGSPYYGRVFVSNASVGFNPETNPGDNLGILKFNADTSAAEEGISSAGQDGLNWSGGDVSPWKIEVSADDSVYVDDLAPGGQVYRWDPTISSNSFLAVLRQDNLPTGAALSGPAIVGLGTNTQIWMGDTNQGRIFRWGVTSSFDCASNDTGTVVISTTSSNLFDVALDSSGNIYSCAFITSTNDPSARVFRFPALTGFLPESTTDWAVGTNDPSYTGASGVAVDPTGVYLAVSFEGPIDQGFSTNGNTKVLWTTNGSLAANIDLGLTIQGDPTHDDTDCAWDAAGNLYYIDNYWSRWRTVSPPGTNQNTTLGLVTVQISGGGQPSGNIQITRIIVSGGNVNLDFSAGSNDLASDFSIQGAASVNGPYLLVGAALITQVSPGQFHAVFSAGPATQYFRVAETGVAPSAPSFTKISVSGSNLVLTFSGSAADSESSFTLFTAAVVNGSYAQAGNATITQVSPGVFQATVPLNGAAQFYRMRR